VAIHKFFYATENHIFIEELTNIHSSIAFKTFQWVFRVLKNEGYILAIYEG